MAWHVAVLDSDATTVETYLTGLSLTTINACAVTALSPQKVLVVVEGS